MSTPPQIKTKADLKRVLSSFEWEDLEVKTARNDVPKTAYETVSAFANTRGGHIVFGVEESKPGPGFEIVGVAAVDRVQNDFLSALRSPDKISVMLTTEGNILDADGKKVLVFFIPEAATADKPVHLNGELRKSWVRRGAGDSKCTEDEIRRFIRNADPRPFEAELLDEDPEKAYDPTTIKWYRTQYETKNPSDSLADKSPLEFLEHFGLVRWEGGILKPTRASILLFGTGGAFHRTLPRPVVDAQWNLWSYDSAPPDERYLDRVLSDKNLIRTWQDLAGRFADHSASRFALDPATMQRKDSPLGYTAFRESVINLLMHQDYADPRSGSIRFHPDRWVIENPGTAVVHSGRLFEPGQKPYRNSDIVMAFVRIGLSDRNSSGLRAIYGDWTRLGRAPPIVEDDRDSYQFRLTLGVEPLMTTEQIMFRAKQGFHLTPAAALALAILVQRDSIIDRELAAAVGIAGTALEKVVNELRVQVVGETFSTHEGRRVRLAPHLRELWPLATPTDMLVDPMPELSPVQVATLELLDTPRPMTEIMSALAKHKPPFVLSRADLTRLVIKPLRVAKLVGLQFKERPSSRNQRYVLTPIGAELLAVQLRDARTKT